MSLLVPDPVCSNACMWDHEDGGTIIRTWEDVEIWEYPQPPPTRYKESPRVLAEDLRKLLWNNEIPRVFTFWYIDKSNKLEK